MTYCAAWKKNQKIFMIADSASTTKTDGDLHTYISSFGERHGKYGSYFVEERLLKLYRISNNIVVCYAGDQSCSLEAIEFISNYYTFFDVPGLIQQIK